MINEPEELERERASDVPQEAEVRADGSYVTPLESLTEEERKKLLPVTDEENEELLAQQEQDRLLSEQAEGVLPREHGTTITGGV